MKMNHNAIFLIALSSVLAFSNGTEFRCEFQMVNWHEPVKTVYSCDNGQVTNNNNSPSLDSVQGDHMSGKSNSDVLALYVDHDATNLQKLPTNIERFFPNLEALVWGDGNLESITADDLRPFREMKYLSFYDNKIVSLDSDLLQSSPKLVFFDMRYNQITNVGQDLLANLNELKTVWFQNNPCINFNAGSPQAIVELKQKLLTQCPPQCSVRCTVNDEIDGLIKVTEVLKEANDHLNQTVNSQNETIVQLSDKLISQNETIDQLNEKLISQNEVIDQLNEKLISQNEVSARNDERILEVEKKIREIMSSP